MKYTLVLTHACNLNCTYCYVNKQGTRMPLQTARKVVEFAYSHTPSHERIDFTFFGGEPLLEFDLLKAITKVIEDHPDYDHERVVLSMVSNGTIFCREIAEYLDAHSINFGISCDGPKFVHDIFRRFPHGKSSFHIVENTIREALDMLPMVMVNAVYRPETLHSLPQVVEYFFELGLRQVNLNPDYSANWAVSDLEALPDIFGLVGDQYIDQCINKTPRFVNIIDFKIAVILRGGYQAKERCRMGRGEYAFSPQGNIFPCERLIGDGSDGEHCIGNIYNGLRLANLACHTIAGDTINAECMTCGLKEYCMNWCGCSNFMSTGSYNRVSPFLCASEKAAINNALRVFATVEEKLGPTFVGPLLSPDR
jgi:uncharacterized protein